MNTSEIITREYVYRRPSEAKKPEGAQKKSNKGFNKGLIAVLVAAFAVIAGLVSIKSTKSTIEVSHTASVTVSGNAAGVATTIGNAEKENSAGTLVFSEANIKYRLSRYFASTTDAEGNPMLILTGKEDSTDAIVGDVDIIGGLGFISGILESYRADDPKLPSYLKESFNHDFCMKLSQEEIELLCKLVEAEAPAEDIFGKILVANVVLNRVLSKRGFSNTVTGVIYEKFGKSVQFASAHNTVYWNSIVITDETREAVARALAGEDYSRGALFFFSWKNHPELTPTTGWTKLYTYLFKHGGHAFYK